MQEQNATVEFINKIQSMTRAADAVQVTEIDGVKYVTDKLTRIEDFPPARMDVKTLTGLAEVINSERAALPEKLFVLVNEPDVVRVQTTFMPDMDRDFVYSAKVELPQIGYERWMSIEEFLIVLRSKFVRSRDVDYLSEILAKITNAKSIQTEDDGVTQRAEIRQGIQLTNTAELRPIVELMPYRTFLEVEQPMSEFLFRVKEINGEVCAALFEADGGMWKNTATKNIKEYLEKAITVEGVYVIA